MQNERLLNTARLLYLVPHVAMVSGAALNLTAIYMKAAHQVEDFVYRSVSC